MVAEIEGYVGALNNMADTRRWEAEEEERLRQEEELRRQEEEAAARETCEAAESQWIMDNVSGLPNQGGNNAPNRFVLYTENKSHHDADVFCRQNGGYLAAIQSEADIERAFAAAADAGTQLQDVWFGLRRHACGRTGQNEANRSKWEWVYDSGLEHTFENFQDGEPNYAWNSEDCAIMAGTEGLWNDLNCGDQKKFLCQFP